MNPLTRKAAAACLVAAPVLLTIATGVDPALGDDQGYGVYRAHPVATQWHSLLLHWAWALFVPGLLGLLAPVRSRGSVLARIAWVAIVLGLVSFAALMAMDFFLLALEQALPDAQVRQVDERFQALTFTMIAWQWPGLLGWALALLLTPLAAARARVIGWWTAGAALAGTALYLAFAISPLPLNLAGPVVLIGAYGYAGWELVRGRSADGVDRFGDFRRAAGRICLVAAPASFAAGMATIAYVEVSGFLLHLGWVLFVPAVLHMASRGRRATRIAGGITAIALIHFSALMVGDSADLAARQVLGDAGAERVADALGGMALFTYGWALPGMALSLLGLIVVPLLAARDRAVPWPAAGLAAAGVVAFLALGLGWTGVIGPLLLLAAGVLMSRERPDAQASAIPGSGSGSGVGAGIR